MPQLRDYIDPQYLDLVAAAPQPDKERTYTAMHLQSGQAVLDVGCGTGNDTLALASMKGYSVDVQDCHLVAYSAPFRERQLCAGGTWSREARIAVALAAGVGVALEEERLIACDVRDLQALQYALQLKAEKRKLSKADARALQLATACGEGQP
jgi:SAM-dependent methyltransferase